MGQGFAFKGCKHARVDLDNEGFPLGTQTKVDIQRILRKRWIRESRRGGEEKLWIIKWKQSLKYKSLRLRCWWYKDFR